jgi:glycerol-3-phosphate dehydrogenase
MSLSPPTNQEEEDGDDDCSTCDLLVIGGGVVGLAVLRGAALAGYDCCLVERESDLLAWSSGGNSGIVCTGVDAAPDTLERALVRDAVGRVRTFCRDMNVPVRPCGSLVCRWPWDPDRGGRDPLHEVLLESHGAGDTDAVRLSPEQVRALERHLDPSCLGAVHIPGEIVTDPWLYSIALAVHARQNGARIVTNFDMDPSRSSFDGTVWTIASRNNDFEASPLRARTVVSATGLWADEIQKEMSRFHFEEPGSTFTSKPRRGQYRIFRSSSTASLTHPIQPVPTQFTKGIFLFSSLYDHIVVGPTALDQESRTDRSVDPTVSDRLATHAGRILPGLDTSTDNAVGDYVGIRPGTDRRDYQVHCVPTKKWTVVAGIRSTGLTASLGIGRHVVQLLQQTGVLPAREESKQDIETRPLPDVKKLVEMYHASGSREEVEIDGYIYRVTHPLTRHGFAARTGIAAER